MKNPSPILCAGMDLDPGHRTGEVRDHARGHTVATFVQGMSEAVDLARVKARVGEDDLEVACRGGVAFPRRLDVPFNAV